MTKIYCIILFPYERKAVALDRGYNFITDDKNVWGKIMIGDIIETDKQFFAGQDLPKWAVELDRKYEYHVTCWTNYYE